MNMFLLKNNSKLIIGLSGGPDSVYLLHQLIQIRKEKNVTLIAAHLDHEWREESHKDAQFCKELCVSWGVECIIQKASALDYIPHQTGSKEDLGRQMRRYFFESLVHKHAANAIVLAHHQDDQLETFFIRLMRGATIQGLACIKQQDGLYLRPLLHTSKATILAYLKEHNIKYVIDASNISDVYLRNRIRNRAIPALQACDSRFTTKCMGTIAHIQETERFLETLTLTTYQTLFITTSTQQNTLDIKKLLSLDLFLQKRILQMFLINNSVSFSSSQAFLEEMLRFITSKKGGSHQLGSSWKLYKRQFKLWIETITLK